MEALMRIRRNLKGTNEGILFKKKDRLDIPDYISGQKSYNLEKKQKVIVLSSTKTELRESLKG